MHFVWFLIANIHMVEDILEFSTVVTLQAQPCSKLENILDLTDWWAKCIFFNRRFGKERPKRSSGRLVSAMANVGRQSP